MIVSQGRALLVPSCNPAAERGVVEFTGGVLELGEKLHDGARREVLEETGLQVEPGPVLEVFDSIFKDQQGRTQYHYVLIDYLCRVIGGEACAGSDVSAVKWVREDELAALELRESIERVVRKGLASE